MNHQYHADGSSPNADQIFVFGSNMSGIHGAGAARAAREHYGAQMGTARGRTGQCYALPTVRARITGPLPLYVIEHEVNEFLVHARHHPDEKFFITRVGCGLAGYDDSNIAPMFHYAPANCSLPEPWSKYLESE